MTSDNEELNQEQQDDGVEDLKSQIQSLKDEVLRGKADLENFRKRAEKDKSDAMQFAAFRFAKDLLKVVDGLDMALSSIEKSNDIQNVVKGIKVVHQEFEKVLSQHGIQKVDALHHQFDPSFHEVVIELEDDSKHPENTVLQVMQEGYKMHERLLRPATVGVKKGQ